MAFYPNTIPEKVKHLREQGKTYGEIRSTLGLTIPKSTLSDWCKDIALPIEHQTRIAKLNLSNLNKGRLIALEVNKIKREESEKKIQLINLPIAKKMSDPVISKIALAMLCLGEASRTRGSFCLGSSDFRIITLFLELIKKCFLYDQNKVRCTVQCRADQNLEVLERYWMEITGIPKSNFYKAKVDPRTKGKPTLKKDYKGVLRVDYFDTRVQMELESLADLIYNNVKRKGPVVYRYDVSVARRR